jgi:hypothetical protein
LNLLFTAIIDFSLRLHRPLRVLRNQKIRKAFVIVIGVFLSTVVISAILMMIGVLLFSYSSGYYYFKIPLESMQSASPGSQITQLLTNDFVLSRKVCCINYIFVLDRICQFAFWRKKQL